MYKKFSEHLTAHYALQIDCVCANKNKCIEHIRFNIFTADPTEPNVLSVYKGQFRLVAFATAAWTRWLHFCRDRWKYFHLLKCSLL